MAERQELIDTFARYLIDNMRDPGINAMDRALAGTRPDPQGRYIHELAANLSQEALDFVHLLIPHLVDDGIRGLLELAASDDRVIRLQIADENGIFVDPSELTDDPISGYYEGFDGWVGAFSQERLDSITEEADKRYGQHWDWDAPAE